jgi:cytochrome c biogenesis protein CcdA
MPAPVLVDIHLRIIGAIMILLGIAHFFFPKEFGWKEDLAQLSPLNRQLFLVHTWFIVLVLFLCGALSLFYGDLLLEPHPLSRVVLAGLLIFWGVRLIAQLFIFDSKLWRGHRRNTFVHVFFTALWIYFILVYVAALRVAFE